MNAPEPRLTFASLGLLFPPRPRFSGTQLPELYAAICERHAFESFEMRSDSATLSTEGTRELLLERDRLIIEEHVHIDFDLVRKNFVDIVDIIRDKLRIEAFVEPKIVLRALMALPGEGDAGAILLKNAIKISDDQFGLLKLHSIDAVGLVIDANVEEHDHVRLEIRPYIRDTNQLFVEVQRYRHTVIQSIPIIDDNLNQAYQYLGNSAVRFVGTLLA